jgi:uncharacterized protein (TIGR02118 family)
MIKLMSLVKRRPELTRAEFDAHWRERHGPLIRARAEALRVKRYVQVATLDDAAAQERIRISRGALAADWDGAAELWWESLEDMAAARASESGAGAFRAAMEDERRFVELGRSQFWFGIERVIVPD